MATDSTDDAGTEKTTPTIEETAPADDVVAAAAKRPPATEPEDGEQPAAAEDDDEKDPLAEDDAEPAAKKPAVTKTVVGKKPVAEDDDAEPVRKQKDDDEPAGRRIGTEGLIRAGLVVALLAAIVTAGLQWYRADGLAEEEAERQRVAQRAGEFGKALLSYDHRDLKSARQKVMSLAAEDFAKTYDVAFTGGLEGVITRLKADATATVQTVYVNDFDDSTAKVVVVMDSEVRSTAGTRRVLGSYLEMRLAKQKDQWRITEVSSVGAVNESMTDPAGTAPKATPTPSPSPSG